MSADSDLERHVWLCSAAGCPRPATHKFYRDGVLSSASCDEHLSAARPTVKHAGRKLSVAGRMLVEGARAAISYERALGATDDEIALAVLDALFESAAMRGLAHTYITERGGE